jgi:hypothetical protein
MLSLVLSLIQYGLYSLILGVYIHQPIVERSPLGIVSTAGILRVRINSCALHLIANLQEALGSEVSWKNR